MVNAAAGPLRAHPPAAGEARKASAAAPAPAGDKLTQANAAQADTMSGAQPAPFDKAAFIAAVKAAVAAKAPKNLDEADSFAESGRADGVRSEVMGQVTKGKETSAKDVADKTNAAPDTSASKDKPVTPLTQDTVTKPSPPAAGAGMPAPAPPEQTDLGAGKAETDARMADADVSEEQLAHSNEPELTGALAAKKAGEEHSSAAPGPVRAGEAATLQAAAGGADKAAVAMVGQMVGAKTTATNEVGTQKEGAKTAETEARTRINAKVDQVFTTTQTDVRKILTDLDTAVGATFDEGEKVAKAAFTADHKARMERYKDARYSGLDGKLRWVKDKFAGLPAEANQLFQESRKLYESKMEGVISAVADIVGKELGRAKARIAQGRQEISTFLANQPKELASIVKEATGKVGSQFGGLESEVDDKQSQLVDDLADRYVTARNAVDEEIKALQDENKGLWDKAKEAVGGAIETILTLKAMLTGVLARAAGAIGKIIKDPIGFLGNLINAVKSGVMGFAANIVGHLKSGLQGWLFGALGSAGIEIPESFDLKGIIKLVLSILGLTWTRIRTKIVKRIGEAAMGAVEKGVDIFQTLVTEGVGGLWKFLLDKLGDLKDTVMSAIQDFVVVKIVKAGITWLISALNPAAAFIKACKMIYDVVMFFVEKGSQIKEFVDSVLDSIESIVGGGVGAVAKHIEGTLAKILPLLLGFLASLLGLGGISEKIREILEKVKKPVETAVDFVINGALKLARPIINLVKQGAGWVKGKFEQGKAWVKGKVQSGTEWVKGKARSAAEALGLIEPRSETFTLSNGEEHTLSTKGGERLDLTIASANPGPLDQNAASIFTPESAAQVKALYDAARAAIAAADPAKRADEAKRQFRSLTRAMRGLIPRATVPEGARTPPTLGQVARHGSNSTGTKSDPDPKLRMESEHVLPRYWVSDLFEALGLGPVTRGSPGDNRMHTIRIYEGAADLKTPIDVGPLHRLRSFLRHGSVNDPTTAAGRARQEARDARPLHGAQKPVGDAERAQFRQNAINGILKMVGKAFPGAASRTVAAIAKDHAANGKDRGETAAVPDAGRVEAAAGLQSQDIQTMLVERGHDLPPAAAEIDA
jgi:hypothetical protein